MSDIVETAPRAVPRDLSVEARRAARQAKARQEGGSSCLEPKRAGRCDRGGRTLARSACARCSRHSRSPHARAAGPVPRDAGEPSRGGASVSFGACRGPPSGCRSRRQDCARARSLSRFRRSRALGPSRCAPKRPRKSPHGFEAHIAKRSRPQMAPQRLEKIESAPGNGMAPEAPDPKIWYKARRRRVGSRPRRPSSSRGRGAPAGRSGAQKLAKTESAPGNGMAPEGSSPQDLAPACEPLVSPAAADPNGARRVQGAFRMTSLRGREIFLLANP